jgi:hypothetical protein
MAIAGLFPTFTFQIEAIPPSQVPSRADAYPHFNAMRDGRNDHGKVATRLGRCTAVILEPSLVGFLSLLARKFDTVLEDQTRGSDSEGDGLPLHSNRI